MCFRCCSGTFACETLARARREVFFNVVLGAANGQLMM